MTKDTIKLKEKSKNTMNLVYGREYTDDESITEPTFYNWNTVYVNYCDGGMYSGSNFTTTIVDNTQIYFRGRIGHIFV